MIPMYPYAPRALARRPAGNPTDAPVGGALDPALANTSLRPLATDANGKPSRVVLVRAIHQSTGLPRSILGFDAIVAAMRRPNFTGTASVGWIGTYPRVVRRAIPGGIETNIAWLHRFNPDASAFADSQIAAAQQRLAQQMGESLVAATGGASSAPSWSDVSLDPYSEANHGPVTWWQSGMAARTRTFDHEPTVTEVDMQENALGPSSADLQNPDYLTWLRDNGLAPSLGGFSWGLALGGAAALAGIVYVASRSGRR